MKKRETKVEILRTINPNTPEYRFTTLLEDESIINIPNFQRDYVWEFDSNIKVMIDDLNNLNTDDRNDYFSGNIIFTQINKTPIEWKLIDGQQRITTLMVIRLISKIVIANMQSKSKIDISEFIFVKNNISYKKISRPNFMMKKFLEMNTNDIEVLIDKWINENEILKNIYDYLKIVINKKNITFWERSAFEKIVFSRVLISNDITSEVFENINHKSKPLTTFELINNKMYMLKDKYDVHNPDDEDKEIEGIIENFEKISNFLKESNSKNDIDSAVRIVFMYIDKKYNQLDNWRGSDTSFNYQLINNLLSKLDEEKIISKIKKVTNLFVNHLNELKKYKLKTSKKFFWKNQIYLLTEINPALNLMIVDYKEEKDYKNLYYHFTARVINKKLSKSKENLWNVSAEIFRKNITEIEKSNNELFKDGSNFESKFTEEWNNAYSLQEISKTILSIFEASKNKKIFDILQFRIFSKELTIEHIFPKSNDNKAIDFYLKDFEQGKNYRHFIGNLALLERGINSSSGKDDFTKTKVKYKDSSFYISKEFQNVDKYTYDVFCKRCKDIYLSFKNEFYK